MDEIPDSVLELDMVQLRAKLLEIGVNVGPIVPSAKKIFQMRLAKALAANAGVVSRTVDSVETVSTSVRSSKASPKLDTSSDVFYAISLPENIDLQTAREVSQLVFSDRDQALKTAKKVKGSRFKVFKSLQEAKEFSRLNAENTLSPMKVPKEDCTKEESNTESIPYRAPKPQDLVQVRRTIEKGDTRSFLDYVWNNPRYLISNGDTPVIYQEGPRYTAMHIAAMKNQPEICREILDTLENKQFIQQLYSQSVHTDESVSKRINFLVDLYLNMPDKASCESPLHMACKFGFEEVVRILAAHPKTDKLLKNKYGETPKDLICTRSYNALTSTITTIAELLEGQYYVPLIRSVDNSTQPAIGQPWSPDTKRSPVDANHVPRSPMSPRDPVLSIKACAGPMPPSCAINFHKRWTTPPSDSSERAKLYMDTKRGDSEKGMERIGRYLAHEMQIPWIEHWDFLDSFVDLSTAEGLDSLEEYLKKSVWHAFIKNFKDRHGLELLCHDFGELATPNKADSCDIVNCADSINNSSGLEGSADFEKNLSASKNLSKLFTNCKTDIVATLVASQNDKHDMLEISNEAKSSALNTKEIDETAQAIGSAVAVKGLCDALESAISEKDSDFDSAKNEYLNNNIVSPASFDTDKTDNNTFSPTSNRNDGQLYTNNNIVSPMTSLSQSFAQLTVHDGSWDDQINNNSPDTSSVSDNAELENSNQRVNNDNQTEQSETKENLKIETGSEENTENTDIKSAVKGKLEGLSGESGLSETRIIETVMAAYKETAVSIKTENAVTLENRNNQKVDDGKNMSIDVEGKGKVESKSQETLILNNIGANSVYQPRTEETKSPDLETRERTTDKQPGERVSAVREDSASQTKAADGKVGLTSKTKDKNEKEVHGHSPSPDHRSPVAGRRRLISERSDVSSVSYKTAESEEQDFYDCSVIDHFWDDSDVGIRLMYSYSLDTLKEEIDSRNQHIPELHSELIYLLVRLKDLPENGLIKVDIVLYPTTDHVNQLMLFENLEVMSCDGNLSEVTEGDVIDVIFMHKSDEVKLKAHFTREQNLPIPQFIHGPEPTKDDLDVCRALGTTEILQEDHPNIFHWKKNIERFCTDKQYRWQSPAKVKASRKQSTPSSTPQRKRIPSLPYGSPISYQYEERRNLVTADVRTALFPAISE